MKPSCRARPLLFRRPSRDRFHAANPTLRYRNRLGGTGIKFFVGGGDGHLWENYWDPVARTWSWTDHGTPPGTTIASEPGALFDFAHSGIKLMILASNGHIFENYWDPAASMWLWTDHGLPPGTAALTTAPACAMDSPATGIKFFVGGHDGHLWENFSDPAASRWSWTDHGTLGS